MTTPSAPESCELPPQTGLAGTKTGSWVWLSLIEAQDATGPPAITSTSTVPSRSMPPAPSRAPSSLCESCGIGRQSPLAT